MSTVPQSLTGTVWLRGWCGVFKGKRLPEYVVVLDNSHTIKVGLSVNDQSAPFNLHLTPL